MKSPTALLVALIAIVLFVAFVTDFAVGIWDRFNAAMVGVSRNLTAVGVATATYTEPSVNPRWGADQMYLIFMFILWVLLLALIALVAEALRERGKGTEDEE